MKRGFLKNASSISKGPVVKAVSIESKSPGVKGMKSTPDATEKPDPTSTSPEHHGVAFVDRNRAEVVMANGRIMSTIPSVPEDATLATHPDGWSECLTASTVKQQILSSPGFPQRIPLPSEKSYRIGEIPGRGMAVIATRDLKVGDLIISERPILVMPRAYMPTDLTFPKGLTTAQLQQRSMDDFEKQLEALLARVDEGARKEFLGLWNSHEHDGSGKIMGIMRTNGFGLSGLLDKELGPEMGQYTGTFHDASRLNHSCCPNTHHTWDLASFSMQFYAVRDIKIGEEITTHYNTLISKATKRQKELLPYGFQCTCSACLNPSDSDPKRKKVLDAKISNSIELAAWSLDPSLPNNYLVKKSLNQIKLAQEQGLDTGVIGPLHTLTQVYICLADELNTLRYGTLFQKALLADKGKMFEYYTDIDYYHSLATWGLRHRLKPGMDKVNTPVPFQVGDGEIGVLFFGVPGGKASAFAADGKKRMMDMAKFWQGKGAKYTAGPKPASMIPGGNVLNMLQGTAGQEEIEGLLKQMGMGA